VRLAGDEDASGFVVNDLDLCRRAIDRAARSGRPECPCTRCNTHRTERERRRAHRPHDATAGAAHQCQGGHVQRPEFDDQRLRSPDGVILRPRRRRQLPPQRRQHHLRLPATLRPPLACPTRQAMCSMGTPLLVAWARVRGNKGARSAGVDGYTAYSVEAGQGVEAFSTSCGPS
jgi:hypothetical protein